MRPLAKNSSGVVAMVIKYACGVVAFIITSSKEKSLIGLQVFGDPYVSCWIMKAMASYDSHVALILQTIATYSTQKKDYFLLPIIIRQSKMIVFCGTKHI